METPQVEMLLRLGLNRAPLVELLAPVSVGARAQPSNLASCSQSGPVAMLDRWRALDGEAGSMRWLEILNASPVSVLTACQKIALRP
jgi:hypothetical protein